MKQGTIMTRVIMLVFLLAILLYFGVNVGKALLSSVNTVTALQCETGEAYLADGYVIRTEQLLSSSYPVTVPQLDEGEKVGVGGTIALGYRNAEDQTRQQNLSDDEAQLTQLKSAYSAVSGTASDTAAMDEKIEEAIAAMNAAAGSRELNVAAERASETKSLILARETTEDDDAAMLNRILSLQDEISSLESQTGSSVLTITAPLSGWFSGTTDGYESVLTPETAAALTCADFDALETGAQSVPDDVFGRLITSETWYYCTPVPTEDAADLHSGDTLSLSFTQDENQSLSMTVTSVGTDEDGRTMLVLSCDDRLSDVTTLRRQSAEIIFTTYSGLRVPKKAISLDESGQSGVYCLVGAAAKWKPVTILYDNGDSYVVALDKSSTDNLWPGDELIIGGKNLYDGKVVE